MLEPVSEGAPLSSRVLEQHHRFPARAGAKCGVNRVGNRRERVGLGARSARAGVDDDAEQSERLRAIEFINKRVDRLLSKDRRGRGQIDQIARVRDDGRDAGLVDALAESPHVGRIEWFPSPLTGVFREDLQRFAAVHGRAVDRVRHPAGDGHVRADTHHQIDATR